MTKESMRQCTNTLLMIRPASFGYNPQTAETNAFQSTDKISNAQQQALHEFNLAVKTISDKGINLIVIDDTNLPVKPDAIFPNNWIYMHSDGRVFLFPMCAPNRRMERREDIIVTLGEKFFVKELCSFAKYELGGSYLEGTGSVVFDHVSKIAYACVSPRTHLKILNEFAKNIGYKVISFTATDTKGAEIYHTNVMMSIGKKIAVICSDSITNEQEKKQVIESLNASGRSIINITLEQMNHFAGNVLEVENKNGESLMILSQQAMNAFTDDQISELRKHTTLLPIQIPTIETLGGGSARCMLAEVFLPN